MSASPEGVAAAMLRYGETPRILVKLTVHAEGLIDLRDVAACSALNLDVERAKEDWIAALDQNQIPASWLIADRVRATGLIEGSRRMPGAWHLVPFRWNDGSGATVCRTSAE